VLEFQEMLTCRGLTAADGRFAYAGSTPHYAPDRPLDTQHIRLELTLNFARKTLRGICTTTLNVVADGADQLVFDAVNFSISRITSGGKPLRHTYDGRKITIRWPSPLKRGATVEIAVHYRVTKPKLGLHFIGPDVHYPKKPVQAWTQGEDEYNRYWFPCHDAPQERATTEMIATVPAGFTAISNGGLVRARRGGRSATFHWKQNVPHSPYLVSLAAGRFTEIRDRWGKIPVLYYCPPGREADARRAFGKTPKMIDFFSKRLGVPYAYAKYSQVAAMDFIYGGMENVGHDPDGSDAARRARPSRFFQ